MSDATKAIGSITISDTHVENDSAYPQDVLRELATEISSCGFTYYGSTCLDSRANEAHKNLTFKETEDAFIFYSIIRLKNTSAPPIGSLIVIEKERRREPYRFINLYATQATDANGFKAEFEDKKSISILAVIPPRDELSHLSNKLPSDSSARSLYHDLVTLNRVDRKDEHKQLILDVLRTKYSVITKASSTEYHLAFIKFLVDSFPLERELFIKVAEQLLLLYPEPAALYAGVKLSEMGYRSKEITRAVRQSVSSDDSELRRLGVIQLGILRTTFSDDNLILSRLGDKDSDVRDAAASQIDRIKLSNENLPYLTVVSTNSDWRIRKLAVGLIDQIKTPEAVSILVLLLADPDSDVRSVVNRSLGSRSFTPDHIIKFKFPLNADTWESRKMAAEHLGTTSSCTALTELKDRNKIETDPDVLESIKRAVESIQKRNSSC